MADLLGLVLSERGENLEAFKIAAQGANVFEAKLAKEGDGSSFGFGYRAMHPKTGLIITAVVKGSAVERWNESCDLHETICVGDRILSVNGATDGKAMVKELKSCQQAKLKLLKSGPRWYVEGTVATCMERIEWAMERGMRFETRAVEEEEDDATDVKMQATFCHALMLFSGCLLPNLLMVFLFSDMFYGLYVYGRLSRSSYNTYGNALAFVVTLYAMCLYVVDWNTWQKMVQKVGAATICLYGYCAAFILKARLYPYGPLVITLFHVPIFIGLMRATILKALTRRSFYSISAKATLLSSVVILALWLVWMSVDYWDGRNFYNAATKARLARESAVLYENSRVTIDGRTRSVDYTWDCPEENPPETDFRWENNVRVSTGYTLTLDEANARDTRCRQVKTIWFLQWVSPFVGFMTNLVISVFCVANTWDYTQESTGIERLLKAAILSVFSLLGAMWLGASISAASMSLTGTLMAFCGAAMMALMIWCYLEIGKRALTQSIRESKMMRMLVMLATSNWVRAGLVIAFSPVILPMLVISILNQRVRRMRGKTTSDSLLPEGAQRVVRSLAFWNWGTIFIKINYLVMVYWTLFIGVAKATVVFLSWLNEQLLLWDLGAVIAGLFAIGLFMFLLPPVPGVPVYMTAGVVLAARCGALPMGFWGGVSLAVALSFALKLVACCGQYMIGFCLGKSIKIQQLVGVDKLFMRGVERVLSTRGLRFSKVSVLVGGPDWPTSVMCGILKLNLFQIILGTTPVVLVSSPCVFAGAFLAGGPALEQTGEAATDTSIYDTIASSMLMLSVAVQGGSLLLAGYFIQDTIAQHQEELEKHRPEHDAVVALTNREAEETRAYMEVLEWQAMSLSDRGIILTAVILNLLSMGIFQFMDEATFKNFQVYSSIEESSGKGGLDGNAWSVVLWLGWVANAMFFTGCCLHCVFLCIIRKKAAAQLQRRQSVRSSGTSVQVMAAQI